MSGPIKTLIVEDDPMVMDINRKYVERVEGFSVVGTAASAKEAVRLTARLKPQLVVLDVYLPEDDGIAALKQIRDLELPVDVILVTAARDAQIVKDAFRLGAVDYIVKPFRFERLRAALGNYRTMHDSLERLEELDQRAIDSIRHSAGVGQELPKGLQRATLRQIVLHMVKSGCHLSAEEIADGVGVSRVTANRYLKYLHETNQVELELERGPVGRPLNRYRANTR